MFLSLLAGFLRTVLLCDRTARNENADNRTLLGNLPKFGSPHSKFGSPKSQRP
ncbi:hypothetical protein CKA32_002843 [Geitlerinema sp. FC II]|nr:hypothetical protein CKA32_002843 [Geitlerinema sp. FC II]